MPFESSFEVLYLEGDMRNSLHKVWVWCAFPIPLPLNPKWIAQVITDRHLQVRKVDLIFEPFSGWDSQVIEFHISSSDLYHRSDRLQPQSATSELDNLTITPPANANEGVGLMDSCPRHVFWRTLPDV